MVNQRHLFPPGISRMPGRLLRTGAGIKRRGDIDPDKLGQQPLVFAAVNIFEHTLDVPVQKRLATLQRLAVRDFPGDHLMRGGQILRIPFNDPEHVVARIGRVGHHRQQGAAAERFVGVVADPRVG